MRRGSSFKCDEGSLASAEPVDAASCSAGGPCRPRVASRWPSRRLKCARLLRACAARGIRKEVAASWREYLLFLPARFFAAGNIVHRVAVAPFPGRRDAQCLWPIDMREMARTKTWLTARSFFGKGFHDFFGSDGDFVDTNSHGVVDGIGHRRHDRQKRALTGFLSAQRAARIGLLDQLGDYFGHIERGRALILKD